MFVSHLFTAVKNVASGLFFLNGENEYPESHSVIEKGVEWEYENDNDKETLQTTGPLRHGILIMVLTEMDEASVRFCFKQAISLKSSHLVIQLPHLFNDDSFCL